ncbi:MAG: hypothetical protein HN617_08715 [Planctomycetaceae bacterium]|nr:hypothetical protein [Planctomycetaceae bacterium]
MYTYQQVRLAGWLALSSQEILPSLHHFTMVQAGQFHIAHKRRFNWWLAQAESAGHAQQFDLLRSVMLSEILTRVWTATVDGWYQTNETFEPANDTTFCVFKSIQTDHAALKQQLSDLITRSTHRYKIRELTWRCERWTDLLLGYMTDIPGTGLYGYSRDRIEEHGSDVRWQLASGQGLAARRFTNLALKQIFARHVEPCLEGNETLREFNGVCSTSILSCVDKFRVDIPESWVDYCTHPANQAISMAKRLMSQWRRVDSGELYLLN